MDPPVAGKSTTLNMIVGIETPTSGDIQIDGKSVVSIPAGKRNVGLVFQDYAVFTSMTVRNNLAFGLSVRGESKLKVDKAVDEVAALLGMKDRLDIRAKELGGSELQRVAIGRTLVTRPRILLLDEPLSNLETAARLTMRRELRRLQKEIGLTIIYVTHDQIEAFSLADRIAVMSNGKIVQIEETARICQRPNHLFVAGFLGSPPMNLISGTLVSVNGNRIFRKGSFSLHLPKHLNLLSHLADGMYTLGIRPESIRTTDYEKAELKGNVVHLEPRGADNILTIETSRVSLNMTETAGHPPQEGSTVGIAIDLSALTLFDNETNLRIDLH